MSYILCLGFKSIVYKNKPLVRLSINNFFIDEFYVNDGIEKVIDSNDIDIFNNSFRKFKTSCYIENVFGWYEKNPNYDNFLKKDIFLKFFELNESFIFSSKNNISLKIFNNDNNYNNGFMAKSTLVLIPIIFLIPKNFLRHYKKMIEQHYSNHKKIRNAHNKIYEIKNYYKSKPNFFNLYYVGHKQTCTHLHNGITKLLSEFEWIGGNVEINLVFDVQNVLYYDRKDASLNTELLCAIANKYNQYANQ